MQPNISFSTWCTAVLPFDRLSQRLCSTENSFLTIANGARTFPSVHPCGALCPNAWSFRPFPRPFRHPDALSGPNFWARARKGADATVRAAKYHAGSWPRQSTAINLKKGGQTELPLFTCTRGRLRPRNGDRKRREGAPQFCTTCVGNERAEKRAAEASRKLISPGGGVITRNFVRTRVSWERNLYLPDF